MKIVESTIEDLQIIQNYQKQLHKYHENLGLKHKLSSVMIEDEADYNSLNNKGIHFFKVQKGESVVGLVALLYNQNNICRVVQLIIRESDRKKGYATTILNYLCDIFDEVGLGVYRKNDNALKLYTNLGFCVYKEYSDRLNMKKINA